MALPSVVNVARAAIEVELPFGVRLNCHDPDRVGVLCASASDARASAQTAGSSFCNIIVLSLRERSGVKYTPETQIRRTAEASISYLIHMVTSGERIIEGRFERTLAASGPVRLEVTVDSGAVQIRGGSEDGAVHVRGVLRARRPFLGWGD